MKKWMIGLLAALMLTGCAETGGEDSPTPQTTRTGEVMSASRDIFAMDTYMTVTCYGERCEDALDAAEAEILRLDDLLSVGKADSEISRINAAGSGALSGDTQVMVEQSLELFENTQGAFDITVYPLMELWGFRDGNFAVPAPDELEPVLEVTGSDRLKYDPDAAVLTLGAGQGIDLGGIAKGYTSDRLMEIFAEYELVSGMVSLGGNVQCYRTKPDGGEWRCGIQDPFAADGGSSLMGIVSVEGKAVITSGGYERYFTDENGDSYHHILDPKRGWPAENGLVSVTIVSRQGMLADGLSTACYVMGLDGAAAYWRENADAFDMILMTDGGDVYITEPLVDSFTTEYPLYVIEEEIG